LIGSKKIAGAEKAFFSIVQGLASEGVHAEAGVRKDSDLVKYAPQNLCLHELPMRTVWDPVSRWEISRLVSRRKPDIVQTHMGRATRLTRLKGHDRPLHIALLCGNYDVKNFLHADQYIACTRWVADYLVRGGVSASDIHLIPNFIQTPEPVINQDVADFRERYGLSDDAWVIAFFGRLVPVKGVDVLLSAMARLPSEIDGRPVVLVIVGEGPLRDDLQALSNNLGIAERVKFIGWLRSPQAAYASADVIAFPSRQHEGFGLVILEAWAAGKPLVTTRALGPREITLHEENALQVDCGDDRAMAEALQKLLKDPALARALSARGEQEYRYNYSEAVVMQRYKELYEELLGR
jgi:glycosyltransferase involved in cell wall biosynthesis